MEFGTLVILFACIFNMRLASAKDKGKDEVDSECRECGQEYGKSSTYLVVKGRKVVPPNKYPWAVALMTMPDKKIFCSGAIINRHFILTAARCVRGKKELRVGFLTNTYNVSEGAEVEKIISHPGYTAFFDDDIALLKLKEPIKCNDFARPICLPGKKISIKTEDIFHIYGWGSVSGDTHATSESLKEARVVLASSEKCSGLRSFVKHRNKSLCLDTYNGESPCYGDSGGSMFKQYEGRHYAIGVTSASYSPKDMRCDAKEGVLVYTSVQEYMDWIQNITGISPMTNKSAKELTRSRDRK